MSGIGDESITPGLVLVDPELAARVRATAVAGPRPYVPSEAERAPEPPLRVAVVVPPAPRGPVVASDPHESTPHTDTATPTVVRDAPAATLPDRPDRRRIRAPRPASIVIGGAVLALLLAGFLPPRQAPHLGEATPPAGASPAPLTLAWKPYGFRVYLVEIFVGNRLVHAASTRASTFDVPGWLAPGRYTWRVSAYGGSGSGASRPAGPLEQGWFVIDRSRSADNSTP